MSNTVKFGEVTNVIDDLEKSRRLVDEERGMAPLEGEGVVQGPKVRTLVHLPKPPAPFHPKPLMSQELAVTVFIRELGVPILISLPVPPADKYGETSLTGTLITNVCQWGAMQLDRQAWAAILDTPLRPGEAVDQRGLWALDYLKEASKYQASLGTLDGLLNRMATGFKRPKVQLLVDEAITLARLGGWKVNSQKIPSFNRLTLTAALGALSYKNGDIVPPVKYNKASSAGSPWFKSKDKVLPYVIDWAEKLFTAIAAGTFLDFYKANKELFITLVKNKLEVYEREELTVKTRPYYWYSGALTLLFSCLTQRIFRIPLFLDDPDSTCAIGLKWNGGGGESLAKWIESKRSKPGFHAVAFSDDQLWVLSDGAAVLVSAPDYKMMDMSLSRSVGKVMYRIMEGEIDDTVWKSVFELNCDVAFSRPVLLPGAKMVQVNDGLASGVPGTSYFDQIMSSIVIGLIRKHLVIGTLQSMQSQISKIVDRLPKLTGMEVKEETKPWFLWDYMTDEEAEERSQGVTSYEDAVSAGLVTPWMFLGMHLYRMVDRWVPSPEPAKIVRSLVHPKMRGSPTEMKRAAGDRCRQLLYAGGWVHSGLYGACQLYFKQLMKMGFSPAPGSEQETDLERDMTIDYPVLPSGYFPSQEEVYSWISGDYAVNIGRAVPMTPSAVGIVLPEPVSMESIYESMATPFVGEEGEKTVSLLKVFDFDEEDQFVDVSKNYRHTSEEQESRGKKQISKKEVMPTTSEQYAGRVAPDSERRAQKLANLEARRREFLRLREEWRNSMFNNPHSATSKKKKKYLTKELQGMRAALLEAQQEAWDESFQNNWEPYEVDDVQVYDLKFEMPEGSERIYKEESAEEVAEASRFHKKKKKNKGKAVANPIAKSSS